MNEVDIDTQIKNFRERFDEWSTNEERVKAWELERFGGSRAEFYNPDDKNPMRLALFLSFMDSKTIEDEMKPYYIRLESVKYLGSMGRTFVFMKIKQLSPDGVSAHLKTYPNDAELLGYKRGPDGKYDIPNGETIRYNLKHRFGSEGINKIDKAMLFALNNAAKQLGIDLGEICGSDAFPLKSVKSDKDAEYNGHYRIRGYKIATTESYGKEPGIIPLVGKVIDANDDEGKELIPHIQELKRCGINIKDEYVDGKYATIENIAQAEIVEHTKLHYNIATNWVRARDATLEKIKNEYQKYHNEHGFQPGASFDYMMEFLVKKGRGETVGYMLRNEHIDKKEECPDGYLDDFHIRNMCESENDYIKNDRGLQRAIKRKGKEHVEIQFNLTLFALHVLALIRLHKGVKNNLVSTKGLT